MLRTDPPVFSVVIPLYNKENSVARAVRSVLKQDFADFEVIVVDDGSTDAGPAIVSRFTDDRVRLERRDHRGVSEARNHGVDVARASRIAFLDADDEWEEQFLSTVFDLFQKFPEAGLYATAYRFVDRHAGHVVRCGSEFRDGTDQEIIRNYFRAASADFPLLATSGTCVPKKAFREVGGFPPGIRCGEDQAVWARLALRYDVVASIRCEATYHEFGVENSAHLRYFGRDRHFDFLSLLDENPSGGGAEDLERWVEKKMYATAMTALIHGDDRHFVREILRRVKSRHWRRTRFKVRVLLAVPNGVRRALFRLHRKLGRPLGGGGWGAN